MPASDAPRRPRAPNPRGQGGRLREELVAAAIRLLDADGAGALTLRAVARETGVAAPSIYRQFTDIQALVAEVVEQCFTALGEEMTTQRDRLDDPDRRLLACCRAYVDFARRYPHRYALLFSRDTGPAGSEPQVSTEAGGAVFEVFLAAVASCTDESRGAATVTAAAIWSGVDGYARLRSHRAHFAWPEQEAMLSRLASDHIGRPIRVA